MGLFWSVYTPLCNLYGNLLVMKIGVTGKDNAKWNVRSAGWLYIRLLSMFSLKAGRSYVWDVESRIVPVVLKDDIAVEPRCCLSASQAWNEAHYFQKCNRLVILVFKRRRVIELWKDFFSLSNKNTTKDVHGTAWNKPNKKSTSLFRKVHNH